MTFLRDSSLTIASNLLGTLFGLLASIAVARSFGPEGRGLFALLLLTIMAISLLTNLGLGPAAVLLIGQGKTSFQDGASLLFAAAAIIGTVVAGMMIVVLTASESREIGSIPTAYWICIAALTPFALAKRYASYLFIAASDFRWYNYTNLLELALRLIAIVALLVFCGSSTILLVVSIVVSVVAPAIICWLHIRHLAGTLRPLFEMSLLDRLGRPGIRFYFAELLPFLSLRVDQFLVGALLGIADVGLYAAAVSLAEILRIAALAVSAVLFGRVAALDKDAATELTCMASRISATLSFAGMILLLLVGNILMVLLYGPRFSAATPILWVLLPGAVMNNTYEILYADLAGRGRPELGMYVRLGGLGLIVVGNSLLIPSWGVFGAGFAASGSYIVAGAILTVLYLRYTRVPFQRLFVVNRADLSFIRQITRQVLRGNRPSPM